MQELLQKLITYLRSMWRYRWHAMGLIWLIVSIGWFNVYRLPDVYKVSATVHVNTETILRPLLQGLVIEPDVEQRLRLLSRTLKSRSNMEKLAQMSEVEINKNNAIKMKISIDDLVNNLELNTDRTSKNIYTISYTHKDPHIAKIVVDKLLSIVKENTLSGADDGVDNAEEFFSQQVENYEKKLSQSEKRLEDYKKNNAELMPALGQGYFVNLQTLRESLANSQLELSEAIKRRDELKRQISGREPVFGFSSSTEEQAIPHRLDPEIQELKKQLNDLLLKYTELHPRVITLKENIERLEKIREKELANRPKVKTLQPELETNPVYQQLSVALSEAEAQVASLRVRVNEYKQREAKLQKMVGTMPAFEAELNRLKQDVETQRKNYREMLDRHETVTMSNELEQKGGTVEFRLLQPPRVPSNPSGPNRIMLNGLVLALGLGAGIGLAFLLSEIRPVIYETHVLQNITGLPVFGVVSRIMTQEIQKKERIEFSGYASAFMLLLVTFLGASFL